MLFASFFFFFFNDTATTEIYTLSLHDALPISIDKMSSIALRSRGQANRSAASRALSHSARSCSAESFTLAPGATNAANTGIDRKSTRLNSSHANISYAVFCLKKKKAKNVQQFN